MYVVHVHKYTYSGAHTSCCAVVLVFKSLCTHECVSICVYVGECVCPRVCVLPMVLVLKGCPTKINESDVVTEGFAIVSRTVWAKEE